jgi:hypothetical protein
VATGPANWGYFKSETGCSVMSSFESMSGTLSDEHWALQSAPMHERNYPCSNIVWSYFGEQHNLSLVGETAFQRQLYLCLLGAGLQRYVRTYSHITLCVIPPSSLTHHHFICHTAIIPSCVILPPRLTHQESRCGELAVYEYLGLANVAVERDMADWGMGESGGTVERVCCSL